MTENTATLPADETTEAPAAPRRGRPRKAAEAAPEKAIEQSFGERLLGQVGVEVVDELERQLAKWGEQDHPLHGGKKPEAGVALWFARASAWKVNNHKRVEDDTMGWDSILLEEVYEALAETDPEKVREELVQTIAVCLNIIDSMERNG